MILSWVSGRGPTLLTLVRRVSSCLGVLSLCSIKCSNTHLGRPDIELGFSLNLQLGWLTPSAPELHINQLARLSRALDHKNGTLEKPAPSPNWHLTWALRSGNQIRLSYGIHLHLQFWIRSQSPIHWYVRDFIAYLLVIDCLCPQKVQENNQSSLRKRYCPIGKALPSQMQKSGTVPQLQLQVRLFSYEMNTLAKLTFFSSDNISP